MWCVKCEVVVYKVRSALYRVKCVCGVRQGMR